MILTAFSSKEPRPIWDWRPSNLDGLLLVSKLTSQLLKLLGCFLYFPCCLLVISHFQPHRINPDRVIESIRMDSRLIQRIT